MESANDRSDNPYTYLEGYRSAMPPGKMSGGSRTPSTTPRATCSSTSWSRDAPFLPSG